MSYCSKEMPNENKMKFHVKAMLKLMNVLKVQDSKVSSLQSLKNANYLKNTLYNQVVYNENKQRTRQRSCIAMSNTSITLGKKRIPPNLCDIFS